MMEVECVYENGVLRPLGKLDLKEGEKVRVEIKEIRKKILRKYIGIVKLDREVKISEILKLGDEIWEL